MRRNRLLARIVLAVAVVSLVLSGALYSVAMAKTKIVVATHYGGGQKEPLEAYFKEYMKLHPDIEIVHETVPFDDYFKKIQTSRMSGQSPDIYHIYSLWAPSLVKNKILDAPPAFVINDVRANYVEAAIDGATINNKIWGYPTEIDNYALVYNKRLLKEAGYDNPPKTWDELVEMAKKMTKYDKNGKITQAGFAFMRGWDSAVVHPFLSLLWANGGEFLAKDFSKALFNGPEGVAALEQELALFKAKATDDTVQVWSFPTGTVGMMIMAPWYENSLETGMKDKYADVGVAPIPPGKKGYANALYTWMFAVDSNSKVKKEAWEFLKWLNNKRDNGSTSRVGDFLVGQGILPSQKVDLDNHPKELKDKFSSVFVDQLKYAHAEPNVLQGQEIKTVLMQEIETAWFGKKTAKQALDDAARKINDILAENYE